MKLSEVPEGVFVDAFFGSSDVPFCVMHKGGIVYYGEYRDPLPNLGLDLWTVEDGSYPSEVDTLKARIAELESNLAKATQPEPAVGQVWSCPGGLDVVVFKDTEGRFVSVYSDGSAISCEDFSTISPGDGCTYIGRFAGFRVEGQE